MHLLLQQCLPVKNERAASLARGSLLNLLEKLVADQVHHTVDCV